MTRIKFHMYVLLILPGTRATNSIVSTTCKKKGETYSSFFMQHLNFPIVNEGFIVVQSLCSRRKSSPVIRDIQVVLSLDLSSYMCGLVVKVL